MNEYERIKRTVIRHLRRHRINRSIVKVLLHALDDEKSWQRLVDYLEYAQRLSEKLELRHIIARLIIYGLRRAPSIAKTIRSELNK